MKILVVDGSKDDRKDVVDAFGDLTNFVVQGAVGDLQGALRALERDIPDVVITEAKLPDGSAVDLLAALRRFARQPAVVVFTANGSEELHRSCVEAGATLYVAKDAGVLELQDGVLDLVRARRQTNDPFRLLGRMTAGVAHDLNNYLTVIDVSIDLLERRHEDTGLWQRVREASDAAVRLTSTLLAYARGGAPTAEEVDLAELVRRSMRLLARVIPSTVLVTEELDEVPLIQGVPAELEQLVINLVLNACDAMTRGGELRVGVAHDAAGVRLDVSDSGGGMTPAAQDASGERTPSSKPGREGAGLGLGIVRGVVERHGAHLRVFPGQAGGTLVTVSFATTGPRRS
jgi:signal transduction histidine kinase